ncbi:MAG: flagellin, partial [Hyphomonas sp.]
GGGSISVLSSLDRASNQTVTPASISINRTDLQATGGTFGTTAIAAGAGLATASGASIAAAGNQTVTLTAGAVTTGMSFRIVIGGTDTVEYIARENDTMNDVTRNLKSLIDARAITGITVDITQVANPVTTNSVLTIRNNNAGAVSLAATSFTGGTAGGGLGALAGIDVTTSDASAASALTAIEGLLTVAVNAAAALGSGQKRIENQGDFMTTLVDSITSGVGALTDADMEAASARLQALQVQQQLGTQALSIANQGSQSLLALFR